MMESQEVRAMSKSAKCRLQEQRNFRVELCKQNHHVLCVTCGDLVYFKQFAYQFGIVYFAKYNLIGTSSSFFCEHFFV